MVDCRVTLDIKKRKCEGRKDAAQSGKVNLRETAGKVFGVSSGQRKEDKKAWCGPKAMNSALEK